MGVGFFGGSFGLGVMEGLGGWLVGGRAGILKSRMGSFLGWELWRAGGLACCCMARWSDFGFYDSRILGF